MSVTLLAQPVRAAVTASEAFASVLTLCSAVDRASLYSCAPSPVPAVTQPCASVTAFFSLASLIWREKAGTAMLVTTARISSTTIISTKVKPLRLSYFRRRGIAGLLANFYVPGQILLPKNRLHALGVRADVVIFQR